MELIKECIQETQVEEGVALYYRMDNNTINRNDYENDINGTLQYWKNRKEIVVDFDFSKTRLDDLIVFDKNPVRAGVRGGTEINFYAPYRFKTINEINDDFKLSNSQISHAFYGRTKK